MQTVFKCRSRWVRRSCRRIALLVVSVSSMGCAELDELSFPETSDLLVSAVCLSDEDCAAGEICFDYAEPGVADACELPCFENEDCPRDQLCIELVHEQWGRHVCR